MLEYRATNALLIWGLIATKTWIQNHQVVVRELLGSHQTLIRQLSGSHQANIKLSTILLKIFHSLCSLKDFSILFLNSKCVGVWGCKCPVDLKLDSNKALNSKWAVASIYTSTVNSKNRLDFAFERAHKRVRSLLVFQSRLLDGVVWNNSWILWTSRTLWIF